MLMSEKGSEADFALARFNVAEVPQADIPIRCHERRERT
jgi:hypothetical protein